MDINDLRFRNYLKINFKDKCTHVPVPQNGFDIYVNHYKRDLNIRKIFAVKVTVTL